MEVVGDVVPLESTDLGVLGFGEEAIDQFPGVLQLGALLEFTQHLHVAEEEGSIIHQG